MLIMFTTCLVIYSHGWLYLLYFVKTICLGIIVICLVIAVTCLVIAVTCLFISTTCLVIFISFDTYSHVWLYSHVWFYLHHFHIFLTCFILSLLGYILT